MNNQTYPTDLTDRQWECIKKYIPPAKPGGRPRTLDMRQVLNAILYIVVGGCQWRMLPLTYPKWKSVYDYFSRWRDDGTWQHLADRATKPEMVSLVQNLLGSTLAWKDEDRCTFYRSALSSPVLLQTWCNAKALAM